MEAKEKAKRRRERRKSYPEWALLAVIEKLEKDSDKELAVLYFGKGERAEQIAEKLDIGWSLISKRVAKIRTMLNKIVEEAEND